MGKALLFFLAVSLRATTFYVANPGDDTKDGSTPANAWATMARATDPTRTPHVNPGDIIDLVANGALVPGDFAISVSGITVQSSNYSLFAPDGYRTNPVTDCADSSHCLYGNLTLTSGIQYVAEIHGSQEGEYGNCGIASITSSVITLGNCPYLPNLVNGSQISIEIDSVNADPNRSDASALPIGLTALTHYKVAGCSSSPACGTTGSSFSLTDMSGTPITIGACLPANHCYMTGNGGATLVFAVSEPLQFTPGSSTITSPDAFGSLIGNKTPVTLSSVGMQVFGTLPPEFSLDTIYYVQSISGRTFQLSTDFAGANIITPSTVGVGPSMMANANAPHDWKFKGLRFHTPGFAGTQLAFGGGTSILGTMRNVEISHCLFDDDPAAVSGVVHSVYENVRGLYHHDNYVTGARTGESQALFGDGSPGPTAVLNNFFEAATEVSIYGGNGNSSGISNANKLFQGNYFYKPPTWKIDVSPGAPTVGVDPCIYDTTDPLRAGGEWHTETWINTSDGAGGHGAYVQPVMTSGSITSLNILSGGSGYTSNFSIVGNSQMSLTGFGFSVTFIVGGGQIIGYTALVGGSGYTPANGATPNYRCQSNGTWGTVSLGIPTPYTIKNSFEFKSGKNFTIIGNLHNYSWANNQSGQCYLFGQNIDSSPGMANANITVMNNKCLNVYWFEDFYSACLQPTAAVPCTNPDGSNNFPKNHQFINNVAFSNYLMCGLVISGVTQNCGFHISQDNYGGIGEIGHSFIHNTLVAPDVANIPLTYGYSLFYNGDVGCTPGRGMPSDFWTMKNNILWSDFGGDCLNGTDMVNRYMTHFTGTNNVFMNSNGGVNYSTASGTNSFCHTGSCFDRPATNAAIKYVNLNAKDYHLDPTSPYSAANGAHTVISDDGTDLGADIDLVNMMTSGAAAGTPTWDASLRITRGSGYAVFDFTIPTPGISEVYTASVYTAPARVAGNLYVSVNSAQIQSVVDGFHIQIPVTTGASTPTHLWYRIANPSGSVAMVGDFWTRAIGSGSIDWYQEYSSATAVQYGSDKSCTGCVTLGASTQPKIPVPSNTLVYAAPVANPNAVSILVTP